MDFASLGCTNRSGPSWSYTDKAAELGKDLLSALAPWDWVEKEDFLPEYTGVGFFSFPQEQRIWREGGGRQ